MLGIVYGGRGTRVPEIVEKDGWRVEKYSDGYIKASKSLQFDAVSNYTVLSGGYGGYMISNIELPYIMANETYHVQVDGMVGNSFTLYASSAKNESYLTVYMMSTTTGTQKVRANVLVAGYIR